MNFDNEKCDEAVKHATIRFIREVSSVSAGGIQLNDKTILFKRKVDGVDNNQKLERVVELALDQVTFDHDSVLKAFRKKKPYIFEEL